jgi:hypothetical protein
MVLDGERELQENLGGSFRMTRFDLDPGGPSPVISGTTVEAMGSHWPAGEK